MKRAAAATILVVDDEIPDRKLLELLLKPEGYAVLHAGSGEEALAQIARRAPDLILLDIMMPGMDGFQVAGAIKADPATSNIPIIMITASVDREASVTGLAAGAEEFLMKPVDRAELHLRVRNLLRLKTLGDFFKNHSAILEGEVQARTESLAASESRFRQMADNISAVFYLREAAGNRMLYISPAYAKIWGRSCESLYADPASWIDAIHPEDQSASREKSRQGRLEGNYEFEYRIVRPDGSIRWIETKNFPVHDDAGKVARIAGVAEDITERKLAQIGVTRLNRVYAVLSQINTLIVRVRDRDELFREACRIAIGAGGFKLAWIALVERDAMTLKPVAWDGAAQGYLELMPLSLNPSDPLFGLAGEAVRGKAPVMVADMERDPRVLLRTQAGERDFHSLAMLPLVVSDTVVGVLALYANEIGFFNADEMKLLTELAGDIAFALDHIEAAGKLERMTRVNAVLSGINAAIVRIRDRQQLFDEACRIAVETGGLRFASLCVVDEAELRLRPVASAGADDGFLELIRDRLSLRDDSPAGHGISARAVRGKRALVSNDVANAPDLKHKKVLADRGIKSVASFPLVAAGRAVGEFALHAGEVGFFDGEEMKLLGEVAGNIALALENIDKEEKVRRLTRVYAVLSGINTLIVRVHGRDELFQKACEIAVEEGGFRMAWIGLVDRASQKIIPVASAGADAGFLADSRPWLSLTDASPGPSLMAVRDKQAVVVDEVESDPRMRCRRAHLDPGVRSLVILPLLVGGEPVGVFGLHAVEAGYFDDKEMKLLRELAGDIAFALDHIDKQERLDYLAYYDALTGLANRALFLERTSQYMRSAARDGHQLALFLIDLERFKNINDSLGRAAGDALLKQVAGWLGHKVADVNLLARIGADHFAVVLPKVSQDGSVARLLDKAMDAFEEHPFHLQGGVFRVATKSGVALFPADGATADVLFRNAEAALKKAKSSGSRYLFYQPQMTDAVAGKLTLENQLREALDKGQFVLHYQPKMNLASGRLTGVEALIRWNDPRTGLVPPGRFIPVLEETGMINEVGRWAMGKAIEDYLRWLDAGLPAVRVAVNVSPLQLRDRDFAAEVSRAVAIDPRAPPGLELEITENLIMEDVKHSIATLRAVRDLGVSIAIDDFGTGFSSLSYLSRLPVDTLKIDRSFVVEMTDPEGGRSLVPAIIGLAHSLKLKVVAEGVETEDQQRLLRLLGCDEMQGYLFGKPAPSEVFEATYLRASA